MPELKVVEHKPPLITDDGYDKVAQELLDIGLTGLWQQAVKDFKDRQPLVAGLVKNFECIDAGSATVVADRRLTTAYRIGAVISERAYLASGYDLSIVDPDLFLCAHLESEWEGVPEAYISDFLGDEGLSRISGLICDAPEMQDGVDQNGSYSGLVEIGAGTIRHFLQFALAS